jgi:hypothetical protein
MKESLINKNIKKINPLAFSDFSDKNSLNKNRINQNKNKNSLTLGDNYGCKPKISNLNINAINENYKLNNNIINSTLQERNPNLKHSLCNFNNKKIIKNNIEKLSNNNLKNFGEESKILNGTNNNKQHLNNKANINKNPIINLKQSYE